MKNIDILTSDAMDLVRGGGGGDDVPRPILDGPN